MIIGLTGASGSGKSVVSTLLSQKGIVVIDCDKIAHEIIKKGNCAYKEILDYFGESILDSNLEVDRRKLGSIVFIDKEKLSVLSKITHKYVTLEVKKQINENRDKDIVIDAPLLIESNLHTIVDSVWVVYSDIDTRIKRVMKRDNLPYEQVKLRVNSQTNDEELKKYANNILYNNGSIEDIKLQIDKLLNK